MSLSGNAGRIKKPLRGAQGPYVPEDQQPQLSLQQQLLPQLQLLPLLPQQQLLPLLQQQQLLPQLLPHPQLLPQPKNRMIRIMIQ